MSLSDGHIICIVKEAQGHIENLAKENVAYIVFGKNNRLKM